MFIYTEEKGGRDNDSQISRGPKAAAAAGADLAALQACLDEGLLSFSLPILVCMENTYKKINGSDE